MSGTASTTRTAAMLARRIIVAVIIVSFSIAALSGIAVLLGSELGPTAWRVLTTTSVVGAFSVAVLCCVSLVGRRLQAVGYIGAGISVVAAVLVLVAVWGEPAWEGQVFWDSLWTAVAASVAFSFGSLLLLLADRRRLIVRVVLVVTLALFAAMLLMVVVPLWTDEYGGEAYSRTLGILAILAALGAIVLPVLSLLLRDRVHDTADVAGTAPELSAASYEHLRAEAARRGMTPDELVESLLGLRTYDPPHTPAP